MAVVVIAKNAHVLLRAIEVHKENAFGSSYFLDRAKEVLSRSSVTDAVALKAVIDFLAEETVLTKRQARLVLGNEISIPESWRQVIEYNSTKKDLTINFSILDDGVYRHNLGDQVRPAFDGGIIDPLLRSVISESGYTTYSSNAQKTAVHSILLSEPGSVHLVNLPTGAGKTFVVQLATRFLNRGRGTTICIVPTVGLKFELAQRYCKEFSPDLNPRELTYPPVGVGDVESFKLKIREKIELGHVPIIFCAPESLDYGFLRSMIICASNGFLRMFAVDEAHLIAQWGGDFRFHFDILPLVIKHLNERAHTPFKTVLLSATWSEATVDTIENQFADVGSIKFTVGSYLRPEPCYRFLESQSVDELDQNFLSELLKNPWPCIVYVNKKEIANHLISLIKSVGVNTVDLFTGDTKNSDRERIIKAWQSNALDVIVATSAFGVGMDKGDVNTVLHFGIPETLDRFYQQSGRSGRDGYASASVALYTRSMVVEDTNIAVPRIIGASSSKENLAKARFNAMLNKSIFSPETNAYMFDTHTIHAGESKLTDEGIGWNWRTLLLLAKYGYIGVDLIPDKAFEIGNSALQFVDVRIKKSIVLSDSFWDGVFQEARQSELDKYSEESSVIQDVVLKGASLCHSLMDYFVFYGKVPTRSCRGCNSHSTPIVCPPDVPTFDSLVTYDPFLTYNGMSNAIRYDGTDLGSVELDLIAQAIFLLRQKNSLKTVRCSPTLVRQISDKLIELDCDFVKFDDSDDYMIERDTMIIFTEDFNLNNFSKPVPLDSFRYLIGDSTYKVTDGTIWFERLLSPVSLKMFLGMVRDNAFK